MILSYTIYIFTYIYDVIPYLTFVAQDTFSSDPKNVSLLQSQLQPRNLHKS